MRPRVSGPQPSTVQRRTDERHRPRIESSGCPPPGMRLPLRRTCRRPPGSQHDRRVRGRQAAIPRPCSRWPYSRDLEHDGPAMPTWAGASPAPATPGVGWLKSAIRLWARQKSDDATVDPQDGLDCRPEQCLLTQRRRHAEDHEVDDRGRGRCASLRQERPYPILQWQCRTTPNSEGAPGRGQGSTTRPTPRAIGRSTETANASESELDPTPR